MLFSTSGSFSALAVSRSRASSVGSPNSSSVSRKSATVLRRPRTLKRRSLRIDKAKRICENAVAIINAPRHCTAIVPRRAARSGLQTARHGRQKRLIGIACAKNGRREHAERVLDVTPTHLGHGHLPSHSRAELGRLCSGELIIYKTQPFVNPHNQAIHNNAIYHPLHVFVNTRNTPLATPIVGMAQRWQARSRE